MKLPTPVKKSQVSLEQAISQRHSVRKFAGQSLNLIQVSQLLWAAKSVPSAGALYPLEIYLIIGQAGVDRLTTGVYHYLPKKHEIKLIKKGDLCEELMLSALHQDFFRQAPVTILISADFQKTIGRYGQRGERYVFIEAGHVGQNLYLQATALGLGTVAVGSFNDAELSLVLNLPSQYQPLYLFPIGYPVDF